MFRLVKILGSSNVHENPVELNSKINGAIAAGSAVSCTNNVLFNTAADAAPDYIFSRYSIANDKKLCYPVTNDMIFKVEYDSAATPKIGMKVGITSVKNDSDAVTFNSSGKGVIVGIENPNMVYVRFQKS